jgi:predicted AAA+ superfamily ATPase
MHSGKEAPIYFYRDSNQKEIDFILEKNMTLYPIEVKKTASPGEGDIKNFSLLDKFSQKRGCGAVLCLCPDVVPISRDAVSVPVWGI